MKRCKPKIIPILLHNLHIIPLHPRGHSWLMKPECGSVWQLRLVEEEVATRIDGPECSKCVCRGRKMQLERSKCMMLVLTFLAFRKTDYFRELETGSGVFWEYIMDKSSPIGSLKP